MDNLLTESYWYKIAKYTNPTDTKRYEDSTGVY